MNRYELDETQSVWRERDPVPPHQDWLPLEKWIWTQLCRGEIADLDHYPEATGPCEFDPNQFDPHRDGWRRVSARFLQMVLLDEPWRSAVHRRGVRIYGAWFEQSIDLADADLIRPLWLDWCRLDGPVQLTDARCRLLSFEGSRASCPIDLQRADISNSLAMGQGCFEEVVADGIKITSYIFLDYSEIKGSFHLENAEIAHSMLARNAKFGEIVARGMTVRKQANLRGSCVETTLNLDSAHVQQTLFLDYATFFVVSATRLRVDSQISLVGTAISGELSLYDGRIGGDLWMSRCSIAFHFSAVLMQVEGALDLRDASIPELDLTAARIGVELRMAGGGEGSCSWRAGARLNLRNAQLGTIQDSCDSWPETIELDGLTYDRFVGVGAEPEVDVAKRGSGWFIEWLGRDEPYTRQPYHQCAKVLSEMGHPEMAADVLYAGRERERRELFRWRRSPSRGRSVRQHLRRSVHCLRVPRLRNRMNASRTLDRAGRWLGLGMLQHVIGFGYGNRLLWRPLIWAVLLVRSGLLVTYFATSVPGCGLGDAPPCMAGHDVFWRLLFSLDMLLPIVELSREHTLVQAGLDGIAYAWFALQRLFGWILALFIVAGLTGLTR